MERTARAEANMTCDEADTARGGASSPEGSGEEAAAAVIGIAPDRPLGEETDPAAPATDALAWDWGHSLDIVDNTQLNVDSWGDFFLNYVTSSCSHAIGEFSCHATHKVVPPPAHRCVIVSMITKPYTIAKSASKRLTSSRP